MADVAALAGVSQKSVSRIINNEAHVSPRLRAKVEEAIAALQYVPDAAARSLAGSRSYEIGVLLGSMGASYNAKIVEGVYTACIDYHYHLRLDSLPDTLAEEESARRMQGVLTNSRCDGFVIAPPYSDSATILGLVREKGLPFSLIDPSEQHDDAPSVGMDDVAAARQVAELFWNLGHRRIGIVNGPMAMLGARRRREGFLGRLKEFDPTIEVAEGDGAFLFDKGVEAGLEMLASPDRPTAIFAANDDSAAGVMAACSQLGLKIPHDVSVCGFDDSWVAKTVWPHLTTIRQPIEEMAGAATRSLLSKIGGGESGGSILLDFALVERGSVGPAQ